MSGRLDKSTFIEHTKTTYTSVVQTTSNISDDSDDLLGLYSMKNHPWKKKPTTLLLLVSLLTIALLLLNLSQNKVALITTTTSESDHHHRHKPSEVEENSCLGRYIYTHNLPSRFNIDTLQDCERVSRPNDKISMCKYVENFGFGLRSVSLPVTEFTLRAGTRLISSCLK
ncbi:hypothetical protein YC2023_055087 [Brassica napus]